MSHDNKFKTKWYWHKGIFLTDCSITNDCQGIKNKKLKLKNI